MIILLHLKDFKPVILLELFGELQRHGGDKTSTKENVICVNLHPHAPLRVIQRPNLVEWEWLNCGGAKKNLREEDAG